MQNICSKPVGKRIKLFKVLNSAGKPGNTILEDYDYTSVIKYVSLLQRFCQLFGEML